LPYLQRSQPFLSLDIPPDMPVSCPRSRQLPTKNRS
jgi:hypothetical protein